MTLDVTAYLRLLEDSQNPKYKIFFLLTYLPNVKCASSLKKILFKNCRPQPVVQAPIPRIYDVENA